MAEPSSGWTVCVGERVSCSGDVGTARYVGEVSGTAGQWVGVEWDEPARGRHDGSVGGRRYFHTAHETGGSLVRQSKLTRPVTCWQSVADRYGGGGGQEVVDGDQVDALERDLNARFVRVIGMRKIGERQATFANLTEVFLRGCCIGGDDEPAGRLGEMCPNIRDLDLSRNLFTSWRQVARIVHQLPRLQRLNVSENLLPDPDPSLRSSLGRVRELFLNRQSLTWPQVLACAEMFPHLTALTLLSNCIAEIGAAPPQHLFQRLEYLELEDNPLLEWRHVLCLAQLPALRELSLVATSVSRVHTPPAQPTLFASLSSLLLCRTRLAEWRSIDALNALPRLTRLKITDTPLNRLGSGDEVRSEVIARLARLQVLNKSEISREERRWAELDYLRRYGRSWSEAGGRLPEPQRSSRLWSEFVDSHWRYTALCEQWGAPEEAELKKTSATIRDNSVVVHLVQRSRDGTDTCAQYERTLPLAMRCSRLKVFVNRLLGGEVGRIRLSCSMPERPDWEVEMSQDKDLNFYGIEDGYTIIARYE